MRPGDRKLAIKVCQALERFSRECHRLPGIQEAVCKSALVEQMVESIRRVRYVSVIRRREISPLRADPESELFDPIRGAVVLERHGCFEEACWLVFVFVHFGRHRRTGWRLARDVVGSLNMGEHWTWERVSAAPSAFCRWLEANQSVLRGGDGVVRRFGNHRKYQSLDARSPIGTGAAVTTYVSWVRTHGSHAAMFSRVQSESRGDPRRMFDKLYQSMKSVASFGRTARFDYLTMLGKLELIDVEPGSTYMDGATGPLVGGRLLFGSQNLTRREIDNLILALDQYLDVGMQVLEDSLCNWQKSPREIQAISRLADPFEIFHTKRRFR